MLRLWPLVSLLVLAPLLVRADELVAVLPSDTSRAKLDDASRSTLEDGIRSVAGEALLPLGYTVLTSETTLAVLADNGVDAAHACDQSCALAAARELKASLFVSSSVAKSEGTYVAFVRLFDSKTGKMIGTLDLEAATIRAVRKAFKERASELFGRLAKPGPTRAAEAIPAPSLAPAIAGATSGGLRQVQMAHAVGVHEYTAGTFTPLPGTATTLTTEGGKVLLLANVDGQAASCPNSWAVFTIRRDGQSVSPTEWGLAISVTNDGWNAMHPMMWVDTPAAGSHTYDLAIRIGGPCKYQVQEHNPSVLIAAEVK